MNAPQQPLQGELERAEAELAASVTDPRVWIMTDSTSLNDD